ncbi:hypothetical protein [Rhodohalobacter sp. SW132]|nr:hypothetical protein [Rhodohalobacter sp. SW132]
MNRWGKAPGRSRPAVEIRTLTHSSDDGKSSDEGFSSDEFASSDESLGQVAWQIET